MGGNKGSLRVNVKFDNRFAREFECAKPDVGRGIYV
jgi:hypothetical protein